MWPFSTIQVLRKDNVRLQLDRDSWREKYGEKNYALGLVEQQIKSLKAQITGRDTEITGLRLQIDELRGQVSSATQQLAHAKGQLAEALKNDGRGPKGRYTGAKPVAPTAETAVALTKKAIAGEPAAGLKEAIAAPVLKKVAKPKPKKGSK